MYNSMGSAPNQTRTECIRCGTCCEKGGPALHLEDLELVVSGALPASSLYTLRSGEPVRDDVAGTVTPLEDEIIKIKPARGTQACIFYDSTLKACSIYKSRPVECRVMKCWDTGEIEALYSADRLTRRHVIPSDSGLWKLIHAHEDRCGFARVLSLVRELGSRAEGENLESLMDMLNYDLYLRPMVAEKTSIGAEDLDLVFGRPLHEAVKVLGLRVEVEDGRHVVRPKA